MNWKRVALTLAALVPFLVLLAMGMGRDPRQIPSPLPGKEAPTFAMPVFVDPSGKELGRQVNLRDHVADPARGFAGEVVVLNFWASWCLACRGEHSVLSDVAKRYEGQGVQFYGVLYNDSPQNGLRWIEEMGGQVYPGLIDEGARTAIDYGLYGVPETFIIGPDGRVAHKQVGPVSEEVLVEWIEKLRVKGPPAETAS